MYGQYVKRDAIYAAGNRQPIDPSLDSTVGIARLLHVVKLSERWTVDPQFLLPFGELRTGGDVSALGNARGVGDLILATAFKYKIDEKEQSDKQRPTTFTRRRAISSRLARRFLLPSGATSARKMASGRTSASI
jgi:hypothetical protein